MVNCEISDNVAVLDGDGDHDGPVPWDLADTGIGRAPIVDMGAYEHQP